MLKKQEKKKNGDLIEHATLQQLSSPDIAWYWIDFYAPTEKEAALLKEFFQFHPLAIEDCFHYLQRPKLDFYEGYLFFVLHALNQKTLRSEEVDLFVGENYIVTFHLKEAPYIDRVIRKLKGSDKARESGPEHMAYMLIDQLVDDYFPIIYQIEDRLNEIEDEEGHKTYGTLMNEVFGIRSDLLKLRRTIIPMRDLLYRIVNTNMMKSDANRQAYFNDIYDHLLKLTEIVESNRDMTADLRDSYQTLNSNRMNAIMMTLTIVSTIFIPLTFIVGVYGMNFDNMPELHWKYGYFGVLIFMGLLVSGMLLWFKHKGWFRIFK